MEMPRALSPLLMDALRHKVGPDVEILTDPHQPRFQEYARRWSDVDRKTPGAMILPETEDQIQKTVQWAVTSSIPFVAKSGGHSNWSTLGWDGVVVDLSKYSGMEVEEQTMTARLWGSIHTRDIAVELAERGYFTAVSTGDIGAIPYFLNGGISTTNSLTGYGSDQIVAARMIDATGQLVEVTEDANPDLLYAIRGAGQFFGLITQLTIRIWPLSHLGNNQGCLWTGNFVFPFSMASQVAEAMQVIVNDASRATSGLILAICPPPTREPAVMVLARYTGDTDHGELAFQSLYALGPLMADGRAVAIQNIGHGSEPLQAKGGFRMFATVGLRRFDTESYLKTIDVWRRLVTECPDAVDTTFNFQWDSKPPRRPGFESANSLGHVHFWQNNVIWYTNAENSQRVAELNAECIALARGPDESDFVDYANATRSEPIERRFRGQDKLEKLRALKRKWDPTGVFTRQLLD
ncbi:hypothetical protein CDD82_2990 [Ophiocordyceps australis]|uniref:FAD-binding PCMH-type domain-containing protein n=1 Tax=Ophiocordyceps australis TaxID=1399860 RepID=A0A2C5YYP0_9HYPO|nr:hypothetical protein CDD82_2990 [Ophiocordyceps australis]